LELAVTEVACPAAVSVFTLHHLTDLHIDDPDHASGVLAARIESIAADPTALWIGGGDYGSLILPGDRRFSTSRFDTGHRVPDKYVDDLTELFEPIKSKCVGVGTGNHEWTIGKTYHRGVVPEVVSRLGIADKYLGERGWYVMNFNRNTRRMTLRGFQYHGWSAGRGKSRKMLAAERDLGAWDADIFTLGHDHQPFDDIWYTEECVPSGKGGGYKLVQKPRAFLNGGSMTYGQSPPLRNKSRLRVSDFPNDSWVESKNFRPQPPVSPVLKIKIDMGSRHRPAGYSFRTEMDAPVFHMPEAA
jgi:hypothetical protein